MQQKAQSEASRPPQERALKSRRKILDSARSAFARRGFDGTNIREIAESVGLTHTLIRYHFGNKDDLWKAVVDDMFDRLSDAMSIEQLGEIDLGTQAGLRFWLRRYVKYCAENPDHARMMIHESMANSPRLDYLMSQVEVRHARLIPKVKELMGKNIIPQTWLVSHFYIISTICEMPFVLARAVNRLYEVDMTTEAAIDAHTDAVLAFVLGDQCNDTGNWPSLPPWAAKAAASSASTNAA